MTYTELVLICLMIAGVFAVCVTILAIVNGTQHMLLDFKREFRRFRDGEQYELRQSNKTRKGTQETIHRIEDI